MSQTKDIKDYLMYLLDLGATDKHDIYTRTVEALSVPRPTVRRAARDLVNEMRKKVQILTSEIQEVQPNVS